MRRRQSRRSRRSLKLSHTQTSVPCGTLNYKRSKTVKVTERLLVEIIQNDPKTAISSHSKRPKFTKKDSQNPITVSKKYTNNIFERNCVAAILLKIQAIYSLWLSLKIEKVAIIHLAIEIHFQTTGHVVAEEKVAEQHIGTKLCSCNTFEDISHLLIMVIIKN